MAASDDPPNPELVLRREVYTESQLTDNYQSLKYRKTVPETLKAVGSRVTPKCIGLQLLGYLPIIKVIKNYRWKEWIVIDLIAGLSAAFIHLPQCLGYGILASLTPVFGLYTTFFPIVCYIIFGTSPHVSMGTNAVFALLTAGLVEKRAMELKAGNATGYSAEDILNYKADNSAAATLVAGLILLGMGLLRLGFLTSFMSKSFIGGFTFSAACHIATSQVIKFLGLKVPTYVGLGKLVKTWIDIFTKLPQTNIADMVIGFICFAVLLGVKVGINERYKDKLKFPVPIELIVVVVSTLISHFAQLHDRFNILIVGTVPSGFPTPRAPPIDYLSVVSTDAFVMAILIFVLNISLAKLTAKIHDITIDDNQELVSYGITNIVGGFFLNFPSSTAPPRTMLLSSSGSKSTLNGVTSGIFMFIVMMWAGVLFVSLPIAMLAAMIIVAMKDLLLQVRTLPPLWRANKADFWIFVFTGLAGVFADLDIGLLVGVVFSLVTVVSVSQLAKGTLFGKADNNDVITELNRRNVSPIPGVKIFRFESSLYFASQERFKTQVYKRVLDPRLSAKKVATVKVVVEHKHGELESGGSLRKRPGHGNGEADDKSYANSNGLEMVHVNNGFVIADEKALDLGDGVKIGVHGSEVVDETQLPEGHYLPTKSLHGEIVFDDVSNVKVAEPDPEQAELHYVILDCSCVIYIDVSGMDMLQTVVTQLSRAGVDVLLAAVPRKTLNTLRRANVIGEGTKIPEDRVFFSVLDAVHWIRAKRADKISVRF